MDAGTRRRLLAAAALGACGIPRASATAATPTGEVQPRAPAPPVRLRDARDRHLDLRALLAGRATALHLMFTGCATTCPPQAAQFAALAAAGLPERAQLLSISIDVLGDTPSSLSAWLGRFGGTAAWQAAVPAANDLDALVAWLRGPAARADTHTQQVFLCDAAGRLCYRSGDAPSTGGLARMLAALAHEG